MPQFLFVVEMPRDDRAIPPSHESHIWRSYESECENALTPAAKKSKISRNVWLLDAENSLPTLTELSNLAKKHELSYRSLLISGDVTNLTKP